MSASKKPRKKYQSGKVLPGGHLPIPKKRVDLVETKALLALQSIQGGFYSREIALDLITMLTVCRRVMGKGDTEALKMLLRAFAALNSIKDRHTRTGKWGFSGDDSRALLDTVPAMIDLYKQLTRKDLNDGLLDLDHRLSKLAIDKPI